MWVQYATPQGEFQSGKETLLCGPPSESTRTIPQADNASWWQDLCSYTWRRTCPVPRCPFCPPGWVWKWLCRQWGRWLPSRNPTSSRPTARAAGSQSGWEEILLWLSAQWSWDLPQTFRGRLGRLSSPICVQSVTVFQDPSLPFSSPPKILPFSFLPLPRSFPFLLFPFPSQDPFLPFPSQDPSLFPSQDPSLPLPKIFLSSLPFSSPSQDPSLFPSQVLRSGRRTHINIPHTCWSKIGDVFQSYARDLPPSADESSGSGSDDN